MSFIKEGTPHVREVGPHPHVFVAMPDPMYQECQICGARRAVPTAPAGSHEAWLMGAEWDDTEAKARAEEEGREEEVPYGPWAPELGDAVAVVPNSPVAEQLKEKHGVSTVAAVPGVMMAPPPGEEMPVERRRLEGREDEEEGDEPSDSRVRRMTSEELEDYREQLGMEPFSEEMTTNKDKAEAIVAYRQQGKF